MFNNRRAVTVDTLNEEMEFDHIIYSHGDGTISDVRRNIHVRTPEVYTCEQEDGTWTEEDPEGPWSLLTGFSGQHAYPGPHMHASEYIGGGLARHILETPGFYVATVVIPEPLVDGDWYDEDGDYTDSWAVAYTDIHTCVKFL